MKALVRTYEVPPGGWGITIRGALRLEAASLFDLKQAFERACLANGWEPDWNEFLEAVCAAHPGCCVDISGGRAKAQAAPPMAERVWRFIRTMQKWVTNGGKIVEPELAARRAEVCAACPENVRGSWCMRCATEMGLSIRRLVGGGKTPQDANLKVCKVCGCALRAKVWFPLDAIPEDGLEFPENCWQKTEKMV